MIAIEEETSVMPAEIVTVSPELMVRDRTVHVLLPETSVPPIAVHDAGTEVTVPDNAKA